MGYCEGACEKFGGSSTEEIFHKSLVQVLQSMLVGK